MTTKTPPREPAVKAAIEAACQKCGSRAKSVEYDPIGMVITCSICGKCAYMDRNNQPIEEQQELEETKTGIQEFRAAPVEAAPNTAEIRRGDNLEYQERQPPERGWEPAIDEAQELEQPAIDEAEESEPEAATNEVEKSEPEAATNEVEKSEPEAATNEVEKSEPEAATNEVEKSEPEAMTSEAEESEPETVTSEAEESEPETVNNEAEESEPKAMTNEAEESESEATTSEAEASEPETVTSEAEDSKQEAVTNEVEESEPETVTNEVEESESEAMTNEAEESESEAMTNEAEESESEAATNEVEKSEPEAATNEVEKSESEAVTNEVEESESEAVTNEVEESESEAVNNEAEESESEAMTNEAEEPEPEAATNEVEKSEPETATNEAESKPEAVTNEAESEPEAVTSEAESEPEAVTSEAESEPEAATSEAEEPEQPAISRVVGESEMQNNGCPNCGNPPDHEYNNRFQRTALRQCTACLSWEINPGQERRPGSQDLAISIGLQMNFQGARNKEIQEKIDLLTENVQMGRNSLHWWIRRYAKPAIERAKKLQVVNSSGEWELDIISLKKYRMQQYYCWSITDSRTQYILATERTSQPRIGEELFKMAMHAAGQEPHTILLSANMKKDTPGLAEQAKTATLIQRSPSEENSNGSMARLRNAVTKRIESARGGFNQETMEYILGALAMSINLFEQSEQLGDQTPAEAAGVETPYKNWEDMVKKEKTTDNPDASGDGSSETMAEGQDAAEPVETMAEGQDAAEPVETMAEGQDAAEPVETMAEGQDAAEPVETMAEGQDAAGPVGTMAGEKYETITQELGEVLKGLEQRRESLVREHQQVVRDQGAVKRTMEILNREQPAVNSASRETVPVA